MTISSSSREKGSALIYILIAIALLAALTVSFMEPSSQQTTSQNSFRLTSDMAAQVEFVRTNVQECVVVYDKGDNTIDNTISGTDPGANKKFPIKPTSTHLTDPITPSSAPNLVKDLRCPGNPGDNADHRAIFSGSSGKYMPPPPALFNDWQWYNGTDGVFFWIETDKSDAYIMSAMKKLDAQYGKCEADIIDATSAGKNLDNASTISCPTGSVCFRVWLISDKNAIPAPHYPDEAGCP